MWEIGESGYPANEDVRQMDRHNLHLMRRGSAVSSNAWEVRQGEQLTWRRVLLARITLWVLIVVLGRHGCAACARAGEWDGRRLSTGDVSKSQPASDDSVMLAPTWPTPTQHGCSTAGLAFGLT